MARIQLTILQLSQWLKEVPEKDENKSSAVPDQAEDWMLPSQEFVAPSSSFMFAPGVERTSIMHYLPSRLLVDKLMTHYWHAVHVIARTVHRPSFERQYLRFWDDVAAAMEPRASFQAVVFAALLSSVISMSEDHVYHEFGVNKQSLVENFRQGTESALSRANLLRTSKLETLQAFVMYLVSSIPLSPFHRHNLPVTFTTTGRSYQAYNTSQIPLCRSEVSRAHSALMGTCIRLAECMGLHRDPSAYSSSPIECQVRRLIWHQICFLDIRTCEATGPRPQIRPDDYDTQLPTNIDDIDLDRAENGEGGVEVKDRPYFTDMTITRMRFECYEMHRILWVERPKIGVKKKDGERSVTLTSLLSRIQSFRAEMERTYLPMLSKSVPLHAIASKHYGIGSDRLYIHILQRFISSDKHAMPERLRQITMGACVRILEHSMSIEQEPALNVWTWYTGALHQFHAALLLLNEMYISDIDPALEQRIWACLDYTFELPVGGSGVVKTRVILKDLIEKLDIYANLRRWRAPKDMPQAGRRLHAPGHQPPQAEEPEVKKTNGRGVSLQSTSSSNYSGSYASNENSTGQSVAYPHQPQYYPPPLPVRPVHPPSHTIAFPGAMPHTDWGTFDASAVDSTFQAIPTSTMPVTAVQATVYMHPTPSSDTNSNHSQGQSSRLASSELSSSSITTPAAVNNPPDPLRDIDWVRGHVFYALVTAQSN